MLQFFRILSKKSMRENKGGKRGVGLIDIKQSFVTTAPSHQGVQVSRGGDTGAKNKGWGELVMFPNINSEEQSMRKIKKK